MKDEKARNLICRVGPEWKLAVHLTWPEGKLPDQIAGRHWRFDVV